MVSYQKVEYLLASYPQLYTEAQKEREDILNSYHGDHSSLPQAKSSIPGDPTGTKATKIIVMEEERYFPQIRQFLETLSPNQRKVVILFWQYGSYKQNWKVIQRHFGNRTDCRIIWREITDKFYLYLNQG